MSAAASDTPPTSPVLARLDARPWTWLVLALLTTALGHMRWGIDVFALLAPIAWLRYLGLVPTRGGRLVFVATFTTAWVLVVAGITTALDFTTG